MGTMHCKGWGEEIKRSDSGKTKIWDPATDARAGNAVVGMGKGKNWTGGGREIVLALKKTTPHQQPPQPLSFFGPVPAKGPRSHCGTGAF